jgi:hypothetical protein
MLDDIEKIPDPHPAHGTPTVATYQNYFDQHELTGKTAVRRAA